jgi:hypothetical protein
MAGAGRQGQAMRLDEKEIGWLVMGAAFVFLLAYIAYDKSDTGQPRFANSTLATVAFNAVESTIADLDTGDHYFHPAFCVPGQTQIFTQHKYPAVSGGSISTLFHHGMDRLSKPAPQDDDWIKRPPGEVMW